jgi:hypothetical protein
MNFQRMNQFISSPWLLLTTKINMQMKRYLYGLVILSFLPWDNTCSAQAMDSTKIVNSLIKCWRSISREFSTIYGLDENEIKKYYKQKVCLTRDSIVIYYGALYHPKYSVRKVNAEHFAKDNFDCSKDKLGMFTDSVYEVTISTITNYSQNEPGHKMTDVIAFDGDFIYIVNDGVIFKLFDADAKIQGRGGN